MLILGSGVAGLSAASAAAAAGADVMVIAKADLAETNTRYAQGGIATVTAAEDSLASHAADTLAAARGLADEDVVNMVVERAGECIAELVRWGAHFDMSGDALALTREGGHSFARIVHAGGDATGAEIQRVLTAHVLADDRMRVIRHTFAIDVLDGDDGAVAGVVTVGKDGKPQLIHAGAVILATGGAGALFRETTNPSIATGDGVAMGYRAGAALRDFEFIQFHPTVLYIAGAARTLVSEAVRGEGAYLRDKNGVRFMQDAHEQAELAPRDVVARAIVRRIAATGGSCVYLDCRHLDPQTVAARFPSIARAVGQFGLDLGSDLIPVHPAAHYTIGGLVTDREGATSVPGLYAAGEVASTGLHGANRLGSNSLLEAMVFGTAAGRRAATWARARPEARLDFGDGRRALPRPFAEPLDVRDLRNSLSFLLWRHAGVEREESGLTEAAAALNQWERYALEATFESVAGWELQNQLLLGRLLLNGAIARRETRGAHCRRDFPETDPIARHSWQQLPVRECRLLPHTDLAPAAPAAAREHANE